MTGEPKHGWVSPIPGGPRDCGGPGVCIYCSLERAEDEATKARAVLRMAHGHLRHGPYGSGMRGDCDPDCTKCLVEDLLEIK